VQDSVVKMMETSSSFLGVHSAGAAGLPYHQSLSSPLSSLINGCGGCSSQEVASSRRFFNGWNYSPGAASSETAPSGATMPTSCGPHGNFSAYLQGGAGAAGAVAPKAPYSSFGSGGDLHLPGCPPQMASFHHHPLNGMSSLPSAHMNLSNLYGDMYQANNAVAAAAAAAAGSRLFPSELTSLPMPMCRLDNNRAPQYINDVNSQNPGKYWWPVYSVLE